MIAYRARFADAETGQLGRMLDEHFRRVVDQKRDYWAALEIPARPADAGMGAGCLVQPQSAGTVKRASASGLLAAAGIIVRTEPGLVYWSPMAVLWTGLVGTPSVGFDELWLGENGKISTAAPTTGGQMTQNVGCRLKSEGVKHYCYIAPRSDVSIVLG